MPRLPPFIPSQIDVALGARLKSRRRMLKLTQAALAGKLGITFQQVQKYETGANRIGSGRLQQIADILGTTPAVLFGEQNGHADVHDTAPLAVSDTGGAPEADSLNEAFVMITNPKARKTLLSLIRALADET
ncbi:helix-turn-helix transcriptional regulator [Rhizobium sp. SIMBA_035]